jgi:YbbR domain-containing protein
VTVRGASSRVDAVSVVAARVTIDASALNVDREFELIPLDGNANQVSNVDVEPERVRVRIAVARELANLTLPVVPQLTGSPARGYRINTVSVEPLVVTVSGEEAIVARLESAPTEPIDMEGRTTDLEAVVGLVLPDGVSVTGSDRVRVELTLAEEVGSRSVSVGIDLVGESADHGYSISTGQASVTVGGSLLAIDALNPQTLRAVADVTGLGVGTHAVPLQIDLPAGVDPLGVSPPAVEVTINTATPISTGPIARAGPLP